MPVVSSPDQPLPANAPPQPVSPPGIVQATAIILYVGAALVELYGLSRLGSATLGGHLWSGTQMLLGLLYVALARGLQRGWPWARRTVLILCAVGAALAGIKLFGSGVFVAAETLSGPVVYAILLNTETARSWFRRVDNAAVG
jgi:hypothetical protein